MAMTTTDKNNGNDDKRENYGIDKDIQKQW